MAFATRHPAPETPPTMREMTHTVARMGGFTSSKAYSDPGTQTLWRGLNEMNSVTKAFRVFWSMYRSQLEAPPQQPAAAPEAGQALKRPG